MSNRQIVSSTELALRVSDIGKAFKVYQKPSDMLFEHITGRPRHSDHWAVKDVSFDVAKGDVVGIIGSNGAGKSTLLRIIAGTLSPTTGSVTAFGKISAILELGTGFHPEQTGRENVLFGGKCVGMTAEEIEGKLESIIDFAELRHVIDQPFKTYSSGMQARLTFATAISIDPDILIIDEALAAGDSYFVSKCFRRIREICDSGATVLFVSHSSPQVAHLCNRAIWLDGGQIREIGSAKDVTRLYDYEIHMKISEGQGEIVELSHETGNEPEQAGLENVASGDAPSALLGLRSESSSPDSHTNAVSKVSVFRRGPVQIDKIVMSSGDRKHRMTFRCWEDIAIDVHYSCNQFVPEETLGLAIGIERERDMVLAMQFSTVNNTGLETQHYLDEPFRKRPGRSGRISAYLPKSQLLGGTYFLSVGLLANIPQNDEFYEYRHRAYKLVITDTGFSSGAIFYPSVVWEHDPILDPTQ